MVSSPSIWRKWRKPSQLPEAYRLKEKGQKVSFHFLSDMVASFICMGLSTELKKTTTVSIAKHNDPSSPCKAHDCSIKQMDINEDEEDINSFTHTTTNHNSSGLPQIFIRHSRSRRLVKQININLCSRRLVTLIHIFVYVWERERATEESLISIVCMFPRTCVRVCTCDIGGLVFAKDFLYFIVWLNCTTFTINFMLRYLKLHKQ